MMMMIRCLSRGPISRSGNSNHHHPAETKKKKNETRRTRRHRERKYLFMCRFVSFSLSVSPSPSVDSPNTDLFYFHSASQKLLRGTAAKAQRISHHAGKNLALAINDNNKYQHRRKSLKMKEDTCERRDRARRKRTPASSTSRRNFCARCINSTGTFKKERREALAAFGGFQQTLP